MNTIGIALMWCIVQITLLGVLAAGLYLLVRRLRPAAAAPVVFSSLAVVVVLSILALSPWPRWAIDRAASSPNAVASADSPLPTAEGPGARGTEEVVSKKPPAVPEFPSDNLLRPLPSRRRRRNNNTTRNQLRRQTLNPPQKPSRRVLPVVAIAHGGTLHSQGR